MDVDSRWVVGGGYRPVRVTFTATPAATADRTLTVDLIGACGWGNGSSHLTVSEDFEIPAGTATVSKVISVPELTSWDRFVINVYEDELLVKPLSKRPLSTSANNTNRWQYDQIWGETPHVLFVADKLPDSTQLSLCFGSPDELITRGLSVPSNVVRGIVTTVPQRSQVPFPSIVAVPSAMLPSDWIDYSGLDVVCLSLQQLSDLEKKHTEAFDAIRAWAAAGGNLWVYGVGADWNRISRLERLLKLPDSVKDQKRPVGWTQPHVKFFGLERKRVEDVRYYPGFNRPRVISYAYLNESAKPSKSPDAPKPPKKPPFVYRYFEMGMVVALAADKPFPGTRWQWGWLLDATGPEHWIWEKRHGVAPGAGNSDFLEFRIPGVGLAPVSAFRILLTLFVLAIGPLNYFLLRRFRRLNLLVITIPAGAVLVTAGLFAYAVIADGFSTRVRIRSATLIDQQHGRAVCWSRMCYYAGLAPSRGLTFPADVAVIPIEPPSYLNSRHSRELIWDGEQWLSEGWLDARTLTQYLTLRSRPSTAGLEIAPSPSGNNEIEVKNNLGSAIEQLAVRMPDGKYYWASDVVDNATAIVNEVAVEKILAWLSKQFSENKPRFPESMKSNRRYYGYGAVCSDIDSRTSCLERKLRRVGDSTHPPLKPGTYVAIVSRSPEVVVGLDDFEEEGSFHVIFGTFGEETQP